MNIYDSHRARDALIYVVREAIGIAGLLLMLLTVIFLTGTFIELFRASVLLMSDFVASGVESSQVEAINPNFLFNQLLHLFVEAAFRFAIGGVVMGIGVVMIEYANVDEDPDSRTSAGDEDAE